MKTTAPVLISACLLASGAVAGELTVRAHADRVEVEGVTPGGQVACLGVGQAWGEWLPRRERFTSMATDTDVDGRVTFLLETEVPVSSTWCVVDLETGDHSLTWPETWRVPLGVSTSQLSLAEKDQLVLQEPRESLEVLLVRPHLGAWVGLVGDGAAGDADGQQDGRVTLNPATLRALGEPGSGPETLGPGDVIVAVDPSTLEGLTITVGASR